MRNIIYITMDCVRPDRLTCYGYKKMNTLHIDKLANDSVRFKNVVCQAPYTPASHMSMFTSLNPYDHGVRDMWECEAYNNVTLVSEVLVDKGYNTAAFVGLPDLDSYGLGRGFNFFEKDSNLQDWRARGRKLGNDWREAFKNWHKEQDDTPQFIWFHHFLTHGGSDKFIPKKYLKEGEDPGGKNMRYYDAKIKWFDEEFLPVILERYNSPEDIIILTSDHGDCIFDDVKEEHRKFLFNHTLKIPLIIRHPDLEHRVINKQIRSIDILPSVLKLEGISFGTDSSVDNIFEEGGSYLAYSETTYNKTFRKCLLSDNYKVIFKGKKLEGLYDVKKDPVEHHNLAELYKRQKYNSPEIDFLIEQLKSYGDFGEKINRTEKTDDKDKVARLKALGYL